MKRKLVLAAALVGVPLLLWLAFGLFGVQYLWIDARVDETLAAPPAAQTKVAAGSFHAVTHTGTGDAIVYRDAAGGHVLRLENLDVDNGPALWVYAVAAADASDAATVKQAGFLEVAPLKGNKGNQTYELPPGYDPAKHRAITIWCRRFGVNFVTAPLRQP
jgi:hypothetical protein